MTTAYFKRAGHCTRCHTAFGANATVYMVMEHVVYALIGPPGDELAVGQHQTVPVCEKCLTVREQPHSGVRFETMTCGGCGCRMAFDSKLRVSACSERCAQRIRRGRKQRMGTDRTCQCGKAFTPARSDSLFCSVACKQRAYRRRRADVDRNNGAT